MNFREFGQLARKLEYKPLSSLDHDPPFLRKDGLISVNWLESAEDGIDEVFYKPGDVEGKKKAVEKNRSQLEEYNKQFDEYSEDRIFIKSN